MNASEDPLRIFGHAVGIALAERKVPDDVDVSNLTFPQMIEATCVLLDRLDDATDVYLSSYGAGPVDRSMQRDIRAHMAKSGKPDYCEACPHALYLHNPDGSCGCGVNCAAESKGYAEAPEYSPMPDVSPLSESGHYLGLHLYSAQCVLCTAG